MLSNGQNRLFRGSALRVFNEDSHIVYVNGSYKGDDAIGNLLHDFVCKESRDMCYPELAAGVKHFKKEGGR